MVLHKIALSKMIKCQQAYLGGKIKDPKYLDALDYILLFSFSLCLQVPILRNT